MTAPRIVVGHPCTQKDCDTPAFYLVTGPHGAVWYCLEHAAKYKEIMAALGTSVHVQLLTEELEPATPAIEETTVESWTCINCLAHGEPEFPATIALVEAKRHIVDAHRASSPGCPALDLRWRLYDRRQVTLR